MGATLHYFMLPADEVALFRFLARQGLTLYPELVPPGYTAPAANEQVLAGLGDSAYYLAAERLGPVIAQPVKRGPNKVLHYERSSRNDAGELVAGRLWAELDVTDNPTSRFGKHRGLRATFEEIHVWLRKSFRRSEPKGFWVGPAAARAWKGDGPARRGLGIDRRKPTASRKPRAWNAALQVECAATKLYPPTR